jgi:hypothetical protein
MSARWLNFERLLIAPTLARSGGEREEDDGDEKGPPINRQRARPELGEHVSPATIYGRARRARLKAAMA